MRIIIEIDGNKVVSATVDSSPLPITLHEAPTTTTWAIKSADQDVPQELLLKAAEIGAISAGQAPIRAMKSEEEAAEDKIVKQQVSFAKDTASDAGPPSSDILLGSAVEESGAKMVGTAHQNIETFDAGKPQKARTKTRREAKKRGSKNG